MNTNDIIPYCYVGHSIESENDINYMIIPVWHPYIQESLYLDADSSKWRRFHRYNEFYMGWKYMKDTIMLTKQGHKPAYINDEFMLRKNDNYVLVNIGRFDPQVAAEAFFLATLEHLRKEKQESNEYE